MTGTQSPRWDGDLRAAAADARAEWRADEEHWASAALEQWQHARTIVDRARDHLHRGDVLALRWPGATVALTGTLLDVADDTLALDTPAGRVDVHVATGAAVGWRVVEHAARGGSRGARTIAFRARLLELESAHVAVEVGAFDDEIVRGVLRVGADHVEVDGEAAWVVPLTAVRWVRVPSPD